MGVRTEVSGETREARRPEGQMISLPVKSLEEIRDNLDSMRHHLYNPRELANVADAFMLGVNLSEPLTEARAQIHAIIGPATA